MYRSVVLGILLVNSLTFLSPGPTSSIAAWSWASSNSGGSGSTPAPTRRRRTTPAPTRRRRTTPAPTRRRRTPAPTLPPPTAAPTATPTTPPPTAAPTIATVAPTAAPTRRRQTPAPTLPPPTAAPTATATTPPPTATPTTATVAPTAAPGEVVTNSVTTPTASPTAVQDGKATAEPTARLTTSSTQRSSKVVGVITMEVSDPDAFVASADAKAASEQTIADAAGVDPSLVTVTFNIVRRLADTQRRLAGTIEISYTIDVPDSQTITAVKDSISSASTASLKATFNDKLSSASLAIQVVDVADVTATVQDAESDENKDGITTKTRASTIIETAASAPLGGIASNTVSRSACVLFALWVLLRAA